MPQPILFTITGIHNNLNGIGIRKMGVGPNFCGGRLLPAPGTVFITGVSKDSTGAVLPNCTMNLFRLETNGIYKRYYQVATVVSDGSGNYSLPVSPGSQYRVTGDNGPETLAGISLNNLTGS